MALFTNSKPLLVPENFNKIISQEITFTNNNYANITPLTDDIKKCANVFYNEYIYPNMTFFVILFVIIIYLFYRYHKKKERDLDYIDDFGNTHNPAKEMSNAEILDTLIKKINNVDSYRNEKDYEARPTLNPHYSVNKQTSYSKYPSSMSDDDNRDFKPAQIFPKTIYHYGNQDKGPFYTGLVHDKKSSDCIIPNALGWPTNFNQTSDSFIDHSIDMNNSNVNDYHNINNLKNANMVNAMNPNATQTDLFNFDFELDPPYYRDYE
jgi:hypothetical protein